MTAVLFDLDGTLLNTLEDLTDSTNAALTHFGYPPRTTAEIRSFIGNGAMQQIRLAVPEGESWEKVLAYYREYYPAHCTLKTAPYPGICEALAQLRIPMAIVSNKPDAAVKQLCAIHFPGIYAQGETADCPRKPAPDMIFRVTEKLGADRCIYVGDSEVDILTASNAGVPCVSVLWGFRDEEAIREAGGTCFCRTPAELPAVLETMLQAV